MKLVRLSFAFTGMALWLGCASTGRPTVPLRCEARPYPSITGLEKIEIHDPAVVVPSPVHSVRPEPSDCGKLGELLDPDPACAAPDGPVCAYIVHPTKGASSSALPDGKFPVVLFSHGNNASVRLYEELLKRLAHEGFIVVAPCCPSFALTAGDEAVWIQRLKTSIDWLERADAGLLPGDSVAVRLTGHVDLERIGVAGHSRGAAESVRMLGLDPRVKAGVVAAPAANNQGQCPQSPLCDQEVVSTSGKRSAVPTDAMDRCCHIGDVFSGASTSCPSSSTTGSSSCAATYEIWTPIVGGEVFANPVDLIPKVNKPLRVLAAEHDGAAQPFGDKAEGTHGGFKRRPIRTSVPTGCFWQEDGSDQDGDGTAWEYGFCNGSGQRDGVEQVYEANRGPSQFFVIDKGLHCGFNQTLGIPAALCDGPPHNKVYSFDVDPSTGAPLELPHLDPRVQFELFTEAAVEFFKLELGGCENYLWNAWYDVVPGYRQHLDEVKLRPAVEIQAMDPKEVVLQPGGEQTVRVTVRNAGPQEITVSFSLLAGRDEAIDPCGTETHSGWCFEAPATTPLGAGETRQIELRVAAPGRHPKTLSGARLFVRDNRGLDAASVALGLRATGSRSL
jgi:pimeloyl-ACP methyl ester carboxylesterase